MSRLIGLTRLFLIAMLIVLASPFVLLLGLLPARYRGARLSAWFLTLLTRAFNRIFDIRFHNTNPQRFTQHHGLVFPNHSSYLDIIALMNTAPVRFLSAAEVKRQWFIGRFAASAETVFVDRSSSRSRRTARRSISAHLKSSPYPPIAIFPEGKLNPGDQLYPFRRGAFELAVQNEVAFLPCALRYNRPDVVTWYGGLRHETMIAAVWRLACHRGRITVELIPLEPVHPTVADDPVLLAAVAQRSIEQVLGFPPSPTDINAPLMRPKKVKEAT